MGFDPFTLKSNSKLENEGAWLDLGDGAALLIARAGNVRFMEKLRDISVPRAAAIKAGIISVKEAADMSRHAMPGTILLNWRGITRNEVDVPYSDEQALIYLEMPDFLSMVEVASNDARRYRDTALEINRGNSLSILNGTSPGALMPRTSASG